MSRINKDNETVLDGRKSLEGDIPEAPLRDKSPKALMKKLEKESFGETVSEMWNQGNSDRAAWLTRQEAYLMEYDEFLDPIVDAPQAWSADLHLPVALTIGKTFHARFVAALLGQEPLVNVKALKSANVDRVDMVQDLMNYTLKNWANDYNGIDAEIDSFIWNWSMRGVGLIKMSWDKRYSKITDVVKKPYPRIVYTVDPQTGVDTPVETVEFKEVEEEIIVTDCDAPKIRRVAPEDLVIIGGGGDVDQADAVMEQVFYTASDLWTLVDQGIFEEKSVEKIIQAGEQQKSGQSNNGIKTLQAEKSGESSLDKSYDLDRYKIIEAYLRKDVDGSGINTDIVVWVHPDTGTLLRATYLHRVNSKTKKRPYAKADFYIREGQTYGIGLIELTYSICKEIDALNNMALDFGLLSSMPFGYYKAGSSLTQSAIPIEPGSLIPLDDPGSVLFPNIGARHSFSMQYLQFLYSIIERLTGINDLTLGVIAGQGVTRTASGVNALMSESNANLDIFLRRLNRAMKKVFRYTFALVQEKMPDGLEFRVLGDHGHDFFRQIKSREEISGSFDFELDPNSANSNPQLKLQAATQVLQLTSNPLDIQLGLITPLQRYEALKTYLVALGIKDFGKYIMKPQGQQRIFTPEELANRVLSGINEQLTPDQDLQGFVAYVDQIVDTDELLGQFSQDQAMALVAKQREAQQMMEALKQMAAQQANVAQMRQNGQQSMNQTSQGGGPAQGGGAPEIMGNEG